MKRNFKIFSFIVAGAIVATALFFNACQKETEEVLDQPDDIIYFSLGCELLPASDYAKLPLAKVPDVEVKATVLDLNVPPVGNQGGEGSCVAWGTTYAARSINWQASHPATWSQSVNIFSPEYVYNQIKVRRPCSSGSYVIRGLDLLVAQGVCTWTSMPYTDVSCTLLPTTAQKTEAALYKISGYGTVTRTTDVIKSFLAAGKPVIVAGPVNNAYMSLVSGAVLTTFDGSSLGGHCYCVVGYDDNKGAFKFMNSWGTSWATGGFGYIAYGYETAWWTEAYAIN
ncbi:MAG: C1 family peptidase [Bacteroidales bacterium]|nr:MAG: C1 family peptidase [Bacteroidales bacterium]